MRDGYERSIPQAEQEQPDFVHTKIPSAFVNPYTLTDQNGKDWDKAIVNIPPGTAANGIDLTGYSMDIFLNSFQKGQIASGEPVSVSMKEGEKKELFKGKGDERETLSIDPWALTKALKQNREDYAAQKAAEREEAQKEDKGYSLSSEQYDASAAKEELAGQSEPQYGQQMR